LEPVDEVDAAQDLPETALRFGNSGKSCFRWTSGNITATYAPHTHDDTADVIIQNTDSPDRSSQTQYTLVFTGPYDGGTAKSEADVVDFMNLETTQLTSAKQVEDVYRSSMTTEARVGDVGGDGSVSLSSRFILIARGLDDRFERTVSPSTPVPDTCNIISKITEDLYVGIGSKTCRAG
ncbi:hypothetical protein KDA14_03240, partial [Candidatus Saccharibacteria bacterium]|nr:hypothetical protein [Candidatus Saccharibacteria bacterium]